MPLWILFFTALTLALPIFVLSSNAFICGSFPALLL